MSSLVTYACADSVATITMDDGKVNVLSPAMFAELGAAFDRAEADRAVVVLAGRPGRFSAGFDLSVLTGGGDAAADLLKTGFDFSYRMLSFPTPVIVASTGHTIAMGVFLLLSGDYRIGVAGGPYKLVANEVAIGMTMPRAAIEVCRQRLTPAAFTRAVYLAETWTPDDAVAAGLLDSVVAEDALVDIARGIAGGFVANLNMGAHRGSKLRGRADILDSLRVAIDEDDAEFRAALAAQAVGGGAG